MYWKCSSLSSPFSVKEREALCGYLPVPQLVTPCVEFSYFSVIFSSFWDLENFEVGTKFFLSEWNTFFTSLVSSSPVFQSDYTARNLEIYSSFEDDLPCTPRVVQVPAPARKSVKNI